MNSITLHCDGIWKENFNILKEGVDRKTKRGTVPRGKRAIITLPREAVIITEKGNTIRIANKEEGGLLQPLTKDQVKYIERQIWHRIEDWESYYYIEG